MILVPYPLLLSAFHKDVLIELNLETLEKVSKSLEVSISVLVNRLRDASHNHLHSNHQWA
jgi:hypothetical protein